VPIRHIATLKPLKKFDDARENKAELAGIIEQATVELEIAQDTIK
jgi:hypothetical protein